MTTALRSQFLQRECSENFVIGAFRCCSLATVTTHIFLHLNVNFLDNKKVIHNASIHSKLQIHYSQIFFVASAAIKLVIFSFYFIAIIIAINSSLIYPVFT